ncbi:hypothetical protein GDO78_000483 [Eleutherodactylus coqui]|uniref:Uncharacterized protein n=1 Tax=Eleutherodactylus coqui TaxID=57060 RepID=A0A8J6KH51_ELECQ|nr:hypothetical protein GDO78_000483 [Eleutherodactylus coqui]
MTYSYAREVQDCLSNPYARGSYTSHCLLIVLFNHSIHDFSGTDGPDEVAKSESAEGSCQSSDPQDLPLPPVNEKTVTWDLLRAPQLSDFGLSHYQLPVVWKPQTSKTAPEEKPKPLYKDTCSVSVAKTPKCALRTEEDFSAIQHFGISDYSANLNDDYTIALKTKGSDPEKRKDSSKDYNNPPKTPAHLVYRNDFDSVDSPLPPVFCTPGLKVHKKVGCDVMDEECDANGTDDTSAKDTRIQCPIDAGPPRRRSADALDSPHPPNFCTPGLKVQKNDMSSVHPEPSETEEPSGVKSLDAPPLPSFKTKWLNSDTVRTLDLIEPIPRPELSHSVYLTEAAPPALNSDGYYENPQKTTSPPNMRDFCMVSPSRPEMTSCRTEDLLFKHDLKLTAPPKVSEYENMLWTPTRPEMTSCIAEDISQMISQYCKKQTQPSWQNASDNKENRP